MVPRASSGCRHQRLQNISSPLKTGLAPSFLLAPPGFAHRHVAPHLPAFLKQFSHLTIELKGNNVPIDMIGWGFNLSIQISPQSDHDHLVYTELAPNSRRLVATPKYLAKKGTPKTQIT
jgi:DNA-binding transcriptional LysR family regulator